MIARATLFFLLLSGLAPRCEAARFIALVPQDASAAAGDYAHISAAATARPPAPRDSADAAWTDYLATWRQHFDEPANAGPRQRLGLPADKAVAFKLSDGRATAQALSRSLRVAWTDPRRVETEHFVILADLEPSEAIEVAHDLERFFAIWTQLFFPLWKDRQHWDRVAVTARPGTRRNTGGEAKMRVVVFHDPDQYAAALASEGPSIGRSTGYYSSPAKITFLRKSVGDEDAAETRATRYHELTHQMLAEATDSRLRVAPGERSGFWLLEGIACYMESTAMGQGYATIGGWEASRLQFARHRILASGETMPLAQLESLGRLPFQRCGDLAQVYAFASAHCHRMIDRGQGEGLIDVLGRLAKLYQVRVTALGGGPTDEAMSLEDYLRLTDGRMTPVRRDDLVNLCLARCELSPATLQRIAPQRSLRWLDLTSIAVAAADVARLCPDPSELRQLSLEATEIDDTLADWLGAASSLQELDLSWTQAGDACLLNLAEDLPLETLWLTGSRVSDSSLDALASIQSLRRVDLQRTAVSADGRQRFRRLRPDVMLDPLEWVASP